MAIVGGHSRSRLRAYGQADPAGAQHGEYLGDRLSTRKRSLDRFGAGRGRNREDDRFAGRASADQFAEQRSPAPASSRSRPGRSALAHSGRTMLTAA
jgi:hypothetical protein